MERNKLIILALSFLTFFSGIIRHDVNEEEYLKLAKQEQFDCVGEVYKDTLNSGSCVLITDRFVLSAAHVFIDTDTRQDTMQINGKTAIVFQPYNERVTDVSKLFIVIKGQKVKAKKLTLHPIFLDSLTRGTVSVGLIPCDIALIELEHPVTGILPTKTNSAYDELNSDVVGVGFGASGIADRPESVKLFNKKIAGENVVDSLSGQKHLGYETLLMCDFDHPTRNDCNKMGSAKPRALEYVCSGGDSGGGLFRNYKGEWELIGICHGGGIDMQQFMKTGYYGQIMQWTRISVFSDWIADQIK